MDRDSELHWRHDRDLSGNNIMQMGIWYEAIMRWFGPAAAVSAVGRVNVKQRKDWEGGLAYITIPDHVEILIEFASGPVARLRLSTVTGLAPADGVWIFGSEGTVHVDSGTMTVRGGRRGDDALSEIEVPAEKQGRLARGGGVHQRDTRRGAGYAHQLLRRGSLHGVHRCGNDFDADGGEGYAAAGLGDSNLTQRREVAKTRRD